MRRRGSVRAPGRWRGGVTLALGVAAALAGSALEAQERGELGIAVGSTVAPLVVEDLEGNPVDLSEFIGQRPVLIEFWASWCENCKALQPDMDAVHEEYGDQVQFLAVAVAVAQTQRRVIRHLENDPVPYPMLWDDGGVAVRSFLAPATSYVVALDATGTVTYTGIGPDQDLVAAVRSALGD